MKNRLPELAVCAIVFVIVFAAMHIMGDVRRTHPSMRAIGRLCIAILGAMILVHFAARAFT